MVARQALPAHAVSIQHCGRLAAAASAPCAGHSDTRERRPLHFDGDLPVLRSTDGRPARCEADASSKRPLPGVLSYSVRPVPAGLARAHPPVARHNAGDRRARILLLHCANLSRLLGVRVQPVAGRLQPVRAAHPRRPPELVRALAQAGEPADELVRPRPGAPHGHVQARVLPLDIAGLEDRFDLYCNLIQNASSAWEAPKGKLVQHTTITPIHRKVCRMHMKELVQITKPRIEWQVRGVTEGVRGPLGAGTCPKRAMARGEGPDGPEEGRGVACPLPWCANSERGLPSSQAAPCESGERRCRSEIRGRR